MGGFLRWLVDRDRISMEAALDALAEQAHQTPLLGRVAVQMELILEHQLLDVLDAQLTIVPHRRFGEVARELGLLTNDEIHACLRAQRAARPPIGELLVARGRLTDAQLGEELAAFEVEHRQPI